jgi:hypothetical protein
MKILRVLIILAFIVTSALFGVFYVKEKMTTDNTIPVITVEQEVIEVSFQATDEELLQGVTAYDEKDKDITDKVIVESVSKFLDDGMCKVVYAVCDSDNNVSNASRKIKFKNYEPPKFSVHESLCYSIYDKINISNAIKAKDCIDGDVSRSIIITSEDFTGSVVGVFHIDVSVTNSKGDVATIKLPLVIEDRSLVAPVIELSEYLIYAKKGQEIDWRSFLVGVKSNVTADIPLDSVRVETNANMSEEGIYSVHYYVTDSKGAQGHSILNVVVG